MQNQSASCLAGCWWGRGTHSELTKTSTSRSMTSSVDPFACSGVLDAASEGKIAKVPACDFGMLALAPSRWKWRMGFPPVKDSGVWDWNSSRGVKSPTEGGVRIVAGGIVISIGVGCEEMGAWEKLRSRFSFGELDVGLEVIDNDLGMTMFAIPTHLRLPILNLPLDLSFSPSFCQLFATLR